MEKRQKVLDLHRALEVVPESSWHPDHPTMMERLKKGELKLTERPIAIQDNTKIYVIGDCVTKVMDALLAFVEKVKPTIERATENIRVQAVEVVEGVEVTEGEFGLQIVVDSQTWNYCLYALNEQGIQCVLTDARN